MTVRIVYATNASQQDTGSYTIKDVKDADGVAMAASQKFDVTFFDAVVPTATALKLTGPTTLEVTFDEVMDATVNPTILVNNGIYGASFDAWEGRTAKFNLSASLAEGEYTVKIAGAKDEAGYTALAKEFTLSYVKDTTVPQVSEVTATQLRVTVKFDQKVKNVTTANFYHTFSAWTPLAVYKADGTTALLSTDFTDTVVIEFATSSTNGKPLVAGANTFGVKVGASGSELQDLWGNKFAADAVFTVEVAADTTAPTVTAVEATAENVIKVTFSEAVANATTAANYVIYDADGTKDTKTITATYDSTKKQATLTLSSDLAAGAYTLEVKDIVDSSIYSNKIVTGTYAVSITDLTAVASMSAKVVDGTGVWYIYVTFPENMDNASITTLANYRINGVKFGTNDKVELFGDSKNVKITTATDPDGLDLTAKNLVDAAGNTMDTFATLTAAALADATAPTSLGIKTVALNQIEVTYNAHLSAAPAAAFEVNDVAPAAVTYVNTTDSSGNPIAKVTMTLQSAGKLANEGDTAVVLDVVAATVKSFIGTPVAIADGIGGAVTDGIAPKLIATAPIKTVDADNNGQIDAVTVTYTEDLAAGYYTPATFTVKGYTVTAVAEVAGVVTISVTESGSNDTGAVPTVTQMQDVYDVALNKLAAADWAATSTSDKALPVLKTVVAADGGSAAGLNVGDTLTLTFSEKMTTTGNATFTMTNGVITLLDTTTMTFGTVGTNAGSGTVAWSTDGKVATLTFTAVTDATLAPSGVVTPGAVVLKDAAANLTNTAASSAMTGSF